MYGDTPRLLPQSTRLAIGVPPKSTGGSAKVVPSASIPVWVTASSHRFGFVSLPAGGMLSPDGGKLCARSHESTLRYADDPGFHTFVVTFVNRDGVKNAGASRPGHVLTDGSQYWSHGVSGWSPCEQSLKQRPFVVNVTVIGALPDASLPARVP